MSIHRNEGAEEPYSSEYSAEKQICHYEPDFNERALRHCQDERPSARLGLTCLP